MIGTFFALFAVAVGRVWANRLVFDVNTPARLQWLANDGYCGEVSTIMSGLKFGQYFSQYDLRDIAAVTKTNVQESKFYLIGVNDQYTSDLLRLKYEEWDSEAPGADADKYLSWVKTMTRRGFPVTICVYMNYQKFYGSTNPTAGDPLYDHIVSVTRIESLYDDDEYHDDDILTMEDHGLWAPYVTGPVYYFNYTFKDLKGTRRTANEKNGNVYTLPAFPSVYNYGIAHKGPVDEDNDLLPVRVDVSDNFEDPSIKNRSEERPEPMPLELTVTVSQLQIGIACRLYRYADENKVPTSRFNANAPAAVEVVDIVLTEGSTYSFMTNILSNQKVIYRAVRADAE